MKQLAKVVREECQFNLVFMNVVEDADVFADDGDRFVLRGFIDDVRIFHENKIIV